MQKLTRLAVSSQSALALFKNNAIQTQFFAAILVVSVLGISFCTPAQTPILTQHNDNSRSGQNPSETILTTLNVNSAQFGKLFAHSVPAQIYAQPLYVPGVTINGASHNVLIVAAENDVVYAFDADSNVGANASPLWTASMVDAAHGATSGETPLNSATTIGCSDLQPTIGITSTPVIDSSTNTIYLEAKSTSGSSYFHRLHALDLSTGSEKSPGPTLIAATITGSGDGSSNGQIVFNSPSIALHQLNRVGLLLLNHTIFIAFASHCDLSPYHGWLFAYDESTLTMKSVYVTTPNGGLGGFWMGGTGLAADSSGNIFTASGNGDFDTVNVPAKETSDSILKLGTTNQTLSLLDYFTPQDQSSLQAGDSDLGSGGVLLLPNQPGSAPHILVEAGKEGRVYVVNRDQLTTNNSHYCSGCSSDPEILQESSSGAIGGMFTGPVYWNNNVYTWGVNDFLRSIPLSNGLLNFSGVTTNSASGSFPGPGLSISSNGTTAGSAIVWAIDASNYGGPGPAIIHAFDATNLSDELWNSSQAASGRDKAGNAVKFSIPTISNGHVYVGTSTEVDIYGLRPDITGLSPNSGPVGSSVTITGANFGSSQGTNKVTFNGVAATVTNWTATSITATVPSGAGTGSVVVTVNGFVTGGVASNGVAFTVPGTPTITSLNPTSGAIGAAVTITGSNFGSTQGTSTVTFHGTTAAVTGWSATSIATHVPTGATTGSVVVTVNGVASNGVAFTVASGPTITSLSPTSGAVGAAVTITGTNFGSTQGTSTVTFNGTAAGNATSWSATSIGVSVPNGASSGNVVVTVGGVASNGAAFTVTGIGTQNCPCTIWSNTVTPSIPDTGPGPSVELGVKFTSSSSGYITGIRFYKGVKNTGTHVGHLWSSAGALLATATFTGETSSGWQQVIFSTPVAVTANTVYVASYFTPTGDFSVNRNYFATSGVSNPPLQALQNGGSGGSNGVFSYNGNGSFPASSYQSSNYWVDVVFNAGSSSSCPCTIWSSSVTPSIPDTGPGPSVELGVKFTASANGHITGIRFYKGVNNTGTHVGHLWSSTGTLLATATFTGETSSGWQQVSFSTPVAITANTVYVASYFSPTGDFSVNRNYFATSGVSNPPLQALQNGGSGGSNGVFSYNGNGSFPASSYESSNYWVDVVYQQ